MPQTKKPQRRTTPTNPKNLRLAAEGPQLTRLEKDGVVQPNSLVQFLRESPLVGLELDLERDKDAGRDIEL
jgi:hypothetical protein